MAAATDNNLPWRERRQSSEGKRERGKWVRKNPSKSYFISLAIKTMHFVSRYMLLIQFNVKFLRCSKDKIVERRGRLAECASGEEGF